MRLQRYQLNGFTILEVMLAILVVAIIAGFSVPKYNKARDLAIEKDIVENLKLIQAAHLTYMSLNGMVPMDDTSDIEVINSTLKLNIIPNGVTYNFTSTPTNWTCTASDPSGMSITIDDIPPPSGLNPYCALDCPSLGGP